MYPKPLARLHTCANASHASLHTRTHTIVSDRFSFIFVFDGSSFIFGIQYWSETGLRPTCPISRCCTAKVLDMSIPVACMYARP